MLCTLEAHQDIWGEKLFSALSLLFSLSTGILTSMLTIAAEIDFLSPVKKKILADVNSR